MTLCILIYINNNQIPPFLCAMIYLASSLPLQFLNMLVLVDSIDGNSHDVNSMDLDNQSFCSLRALHTSKY